ncbi:hypothetical protein DFP72DRAFT_848880 [Ephemerocybe angulata]|uniref:Uncharacterized protein n=1 Tax=Ephemerocybe angulata TaxID=980116 RepID=A0A8H6HWI4_9AGAR|nr:hypothetical protein DFP72DRAFT_848880 [Tulosesus angulatus]
MAEAYWADSIPSDPDIRFNRVTGIVKRIIVKASSPEDVVDEYIASVKANVDHAKAVSLLFLNVFQDLRQRGFTEEADEFRATVQSRIQDVVQGAWSVSINDPSQARQLYGVTVLLADLYTSALLEPQIFETLLQQAIHDFQSAFKLESLLVCVARASYCMASTPLPDPIHEELLAKASCSHFTTRRGRDLAEAIHRRDATTCRILYTTLHSGVMDRLKPMIVESADQGSMRQRKYTIADLPVPFISRKNTPSPAVQSPAIGSI